MNITLSVDDSVVTQARLVAQSMGTSLNQLVRDYLAGLADPSEAHDDLAEFRRLSSEGHGDSKGWRFDRDDLHARP
jgi:hypothetical protein